MRIDAVLLAGQKFDYSRSVCIVVDVLRASSSIVTLLGGGARPVIAAGSIDDARALREQLPDYLLCGEVGGLPPPGFDYGNSPDEFSRAPLEGRGAILATSNGTRLLAQLKDAPAVLVGCLLNRTAAARAAIETAQVQALDIMVTCSAAYGGSTFVLEDALGTGAIVEAALSADQSIEAADAAYFARAAFVTASRDLPGAVAAAYHARELTEAGLAADVACCAQLDVSPLVPMLERTENGALALLPYGE
jgi:2-phosphosulfolactate phosphatase